jgi:hypothetical protein
LERGSFGASFYVIKSISIFFEKSAFSKGGGPLNHYYELFLTTHPLTHASTVYLTAAFNNRAVVIITYEVPVSRPNIIDFHLMFQDVHATIFVILVEVLFPIISTSLKF